MGNICVEYKCVEGHQWFLICFLRMIALFSAMHRWRRGLESPKFWKIMKESLGRSLIKRRLHSFSIKIQGWRLKKQLKICLGPQIIHQHERYFGLPPLVEKGKKKAFHRIKDQVGHKITSWKGKLLTTVGQEILIKAVAQATPMYTMNCFKISDSLCSELNSLISNFWWGQCDKERKLAWVAWEKMCKSKADGGIGFKDLKPFNLALLAKQGWQLVQNPGSLAHRVLKVKYFLESNFMEAQLGKKPLYTWRSLVAVREVLDRGL